jgi:hypothetical protein
MRWLRKDNFDQLWHLALVIVAVVLWAVLFVSCMVASLVLEKIRGAIPNRFASYRRACRRAIRHRILVPKRKV